MRTALIAVSAAFIPSVIGNDLWAFTHLAGGDPDKMECDGIGQPGSTFAEPLRSRKSLRKQAYSLRSSSTRRSS